MDLQAPSIRGIKEDSYGRQEFLQIMSDCFRSPAEACNAEDDIVDFAHPPQVAFVELRLVFVACA